VSRPASRRRRHQCLSPLPMPSLPTRNTVTWTQKLLPQVTIFFTSPSVQLLHALLMTFMQLRRHRLTPPASSPNPSSHSHLQVQSSSCSRKFSMICSALARAACWSSMICSALARAARSLAKASVLARRPGNVAFIWMANDSCRFMFPMHRARCPQAK